MTKKRERNQKGFWKKKKRRMTHEVKVKENQLQSQSNPQEEVKVKTKVIPDEVISVLFVPCTPLRELAKMLRRDEKEISKLSRYRIKIVERTGTRLGDLLRNKGPNYGKECGRESCHPCKARDSQKKKYPCWDRSVLYRAFCLKCKEEGKVAEYIGETGKSVFQRSSNHYDSVKYRRSSSFMLRHQLRSHPEEGRSILS